jgi:hypothetical protein
MAVGADKLQKCQIESTVVNGISRLYIIVLHRAYRTYIDSAYRTQSYGTSRWFPLHRRSLHFVVLSISASSLLCRFKIIVEGYENGVC